MKLVEASRFANHPENVDADKKSNLAEHEPEPAPMQGNNVTKEITRDKPHQSNLDSLSNSAAR